MLRPLTGPAHDAVILVARLLLGVVLVAHGAQKFFQYGLGGVAASFAKMGVPVPPLSAGFAAVVELGAGILLILGAATTIAAGLVVLDMIGAAIFGHDLTSVLSSSKGWELPGLVAVGALLLLATGAGRFSLDHALLARHTARADRELIG